MKPELNSHLEQIKKVIEVSEEVRITKQKLLAAEKLRAASILLAINFELGNCVTTIVKDTSTRNE